MLTVCPTLLKNRDILLSNTYHRVKNVPVPVVDMSGPEDITTTPKQRFDDFEAMRQFAVAWVEKTCFPDNDLVPFIETGNTVALVAEAFGCKIEFPENSTARALPAFTDLSTVWRLKPKKLFDCLLIRRNFEWVDYAQQHLGTNIGYWTMDLQGPLSVAADIIGAENMIMGCMLYPKEMHHLVQMITDFSIEYMEKHLAQLEHPLFPGRNFPSIDEKIGVCVADDTPLVMLNPALYEEFSLPYLNQIGQRFGGLHIHSCGNYKHTLPSLLKLDCLKSIQVHGGQREFPLPQTDTNDDPFNQARDKICCYVDVNPITLGDEYIDRPKQYYMDYLIPRLKNGKPYDGLMVMAYPCSQKDIQQYRDSFVWTKSQFAK